MKPLFILIVSFSFVYSAHGQNLSDSGFTNKAEAKNLMVNGKKEGKWCELIYFDSSLRDTIGYFLAVYKAGKPNGIQRDYNQKGTLIQMDRYVNGFRNGRCITYYDNGAIESESEYRMDTIIGASKVYDEDGKIKEPYIHYKKEGIKKTYMPGDSSTWREKSYHNDLPDGEEKTYYKGKLIIERVWEKGKLVSEWKCDANTGEEKK
jgi:antitoxin component YwqK of YwqJK toxin-antitoxin module